MNKKNRLSGQILRIAALAIAISLIFGATSIFYADSDFGGEVPMPGDETTTSTSEETTSSSSGEETTTSSSGEETTTSSSSEETTTSSSGEETTTSSSEETTSSTSGTAESTFSSVGTYEYGEDYAWMIINESMANALVFEENRVECELGSSVYLYDQNGERIGTLDEAVADGATVEFSAKVGTTELLLNEQDMLAYIDHSHFDGVEAGDSVVAEVDLRVTYMDETVEDKFYFCVDITSDDYVVGVELAGNNTEITVPVGSTVNVEFDVTYAEGVDELCAWYVKTGDTTIATAETGEVEDPIVTIPISVTGVKEGTTTLVLQVVDDPFYPSDKHYVTVTVNVVANDDDPTVPKFAWMDSVDMGEVVSTDFVDNLKDGDSYEVDVSKCIELIDSHDGVICTLDEAIKDGATVSIDESSAYADPADSSVSNIAIVPVANSPIFSVTANCLKGAEHGDTATIYFSMTVNYKGETVSQDFEYTINVMSLSDYFRSIVLTSGSDPVSLKPGETAELVYKINYLDAEDNNGAVASIKVDDTSIATATVTVNEAGTEMKVTVTAGDKEGTTDLELTVSDPDENLGTVIIPIEVTVKKDTTSTTSKNESSNTTGNNPDTEDISVSSDPSRSTAAVIMLTLGLLIVGALAAERIWRMMENNKHRANMIRR